MKFSRKFYPGLLTLSVLGVTPLISHAQIAPAPPTTEPRETLTIVTPEVDLEHHQITLPAAFWNPKMTDWVEVALSGRPGDFLHETVLSVTTTRTQMVQALRKVGFQDIDTWLTDRADIPRIRGDRALILLEFTRNGITETYSLDELLTFQGWNVSLGPTGWIFKGDTFNDMAHPPQVLAGNAATQSSVPATLPAPPATLPDDLEKNLTPGQRILRDDPQMALVFRGIQHLSRSFMDYPLAYDEWIYPNFRMHRNYKLLPPEVLDSNGAVPVKMIIRKVTETELLQESAKVWHDPEYAKFILAQLPIAQELDNARAEYQKRLSALRKRAAALQGLDAGSLPLNQTEEFFVMGVAAAGVELGYRKLDNAWTTWACEHAQPEKMSPEETAAFNKTSKLWQQHIHDQMERAENLVNLEAYSGFETFVARNGGSLDPIKLRMLQAGQIKARNQIILLENSQVLDYWHYEQNRLDADDPRTSWRAHIAVQVDLAEARKAVGETGVALAEAMDPDFKENSVPLLSKLKAQHRLALLKVGVCGIKAQLDQVEFEISKREGMEGDETLPLLVKERTRLQEQLEVATEAYEKELGTGTTLPTTTSATNPAPPK